MWSANTAPGYRSAGILLLCVLTAGCLAPVTSHGPAGANMVALQTNVERLQEQQKEMASQVDRLEQGDQQLSPRGLPLDLQTELNLIRDRLAVLEVRIAEMARNTQQATERMSGLTYDLQRLKRRTDQLETLEADQQQGQEQLPTEGGALDARGVPIPSAGPPGLVLPGSTGAAPQGDEPERLFQKAYADYTRGDYDLAVLGFTSVLNLNPRGHLSDDSIYYLAEIAAVRGQVNQALAGYARVEREFANSDKIPAAILKRGLLLIEANRIGEGVVQLDHLVKSYPESDEARLARNKLRALGVGP